jgi:hypothetical protein
VEVNDRNMPAGEINGAYGPPRYFRVDSGFPANGGIIVHPHEDVTDEVAALRAELADWQNDCAKETRRRLELQAEVERLRHDQHDAVYTPQLIRAEKAEAERDETITSRNRWIEQAKNAQAERDEVRQELIEARHKLLEQHERVNAMHPVVEAVSGMSKLGKNPPGMRASDAAAWDRAVDAYREATR